MLIRKATGRDFTLWCLFTRKCLRNITKEEYRCSTPEQASFFMDSIHKDLTKIKDKSEMKIVFINGSEVKLIIDQLVTYK